jgi:hypothetical protein
VQRNPFFFVITMLFTVASTMAVTARDAAAVDAVAPSYTFTSIPYPGSSASWSYGINDYFSTVGEAYVSPPPGSINTYVRHGDGTFNQIASEGGSVVAIGINNLGQIVGTETQGDNNPSYGFMIDKGGTFASASMLQYPDAFFTSANDINDTEFVIGNFCLTATSGCSSYFRDRNGKYFELTYPGSTVTQAYGVNDWDEIVGNYYVGTGVGPTGIPYTMDICAVQVAGLFLLCIPAQRKRSQWASTISAKSWVSTGLLVWVRTAFCAIARGFLTALIILDQLLLRRGASTTLAPSPAITPVQQLQMKRSWR